MDGHRDSPNSGAVPCLLLFRYPDDLQYSMDSLSETNEVVNVTVLGECETKFPGRLTDYSTLGLEFTCDPFVSVGAAVKVEWGHTLLQGEVLHCRPEPGGFAIGLSLEHALYNSGELRRLAERLLDEARHPITGKTNL